VTTWRRRLSIVMIPSITIASFVIITRTLSFGTISWTPRAAQWAARCGRADINVIRDVGMWVEVKHLMEYIAEGRAFHARMMQDHDVDPIF
jgi:hypothetical protein